MAAPKSAQYSYETERIPLIGNPRNRLASASKDQVFYNVIPDIAKSPIGESKSIWLSKRGGFTSFATVIGAGGAGRGLYYWSRTGKNYSVVGDKLYATATAIQTLATSTGTCWFHEATGTSDVLILSDGTDMYTISLSDVVTDITDAQLPAGPLSPVSLDGYVFVAKSGTDEIWNSDVDAPTAWDAASFLSAEMYPDNLVLLSRHLSYILAFGTFSTEVFYDNENASGSPLRRAETSAMKVGLVARDSVAQADKRTLFVGQSAIGEPSIWKMDGLTSTRVSDEFIDKILVTEGANLPNATAWICHHKGHTLYVLNLNERTLVYDCDENVWGQWSINSSSTHAVLPFKFSTQGANNVILVLHNTDGKIYKLDKDTFTDDAGVILVDIITTRVDFKSTRQKRQLRLELLADKESTGTVTVSWSDDDYQTWSATRSLDLTTRPFTKAGGVFRRRAYRFQHSSNNPFRATALEIDYSEGFS